MRFQDEFSNLILAVQLSQVDRLTVNNRTNKTTHGKYGRGIVELGVNRFDRLTGRGRRRQRRPRCRRLGRRRGRRRRGLRRRRRVAEHWRLLPVRLLFVFVDAQVDERFRMDRHCTGKSKIDYEQFCRRKKKPSISGRYVYITYDVQGDLRVKSRASCQIYR